MRGSIVTGEFIYNEIKKLDRELDDVYSALEDIPKSSAAYDILKGVYDQKQKDLHALKSRKYLAN